MSSPDPLEPVIEAMSSPDPLEPAIEPGRPIIDAHHHFYASGGLELTPEGFADMARDGHRVVASVYMEEGARYRESGPEPLRPVGETAWVDGIATAAAQGRFGASTHGDELRLCAGIVGRADLTLGDRVTMVLEEHLEASPDHFRGIRALIHNDPGVDHIIRTADRYLDTDDTAFNSAVACLGPLDLSLDLVFFFRQFPQVARLAERHPGVAIVANHLGGILGVGDYRGRRDEYFDQWRSEMEAAAACPNLVMKLGGSGMIVSGYRWHKRDAPPNSTEVAEAYRPWYEAAIEAFGPQRCMFESNYPMDMPSYSYRTLWNAMKRLTQGYSEAEKTAMYRGTAERVYRLDIPRGSTLAPSERI